jgi:vitamin B12 transporter
MLAAWTLLGIAGGSIPNAAAVPPEPRVEETLVVTASLEEEEPAALPVTVSVVGASEIASRQVTEVSDVLATVAGLDVARLGGPGKLTSLFTRGTNSTHTLVLWNGVEVNDPFFGGFDASALATDGLDRVEVVRGPASSLYGSDALGGVVQVVSGHRDGIGARLEGGSDDYLRAGLAAGLERGAFRFDLDGHVRRGDGEVANDFYDGEEAVARGEWEVAEGTTVGLLARAGEATIGLPFDFLGQPSPQRTQDSETTQVTVPFRWRREAWEVSAQAARHAIEIALDDPDDPFAASRSEGEALSGRAVATRHFGEDRWLAFGGEWEQEEATSASAFGPGLTADRQRTWAGFAEGHLERDEWILDLGARRDDNDAFGAATTGRAGLRRALSGGAHLRAAWSEGFRAPSLGDLYFPGFGNPELVPERSTSWELGGGLERRSWRLDVALFTIDIDDLIVFDFTTFLPQNIGRAESRGVEAEADFGGGRLWGRANVTWLEAEDRSTGEPLARRPRWRGSLVVGFTDEPWRLTATGRYVGEREDVGGVPLADYALVALAVERRSAAHLAPYGRVENLFDEDYEEAVGFPGAGRSVVVGLAVDFGGS